MPIVVFLFPGEPLKHLLYLQRYRQIQWVNTLAIVRSFKLCSFLANFSVVLMRYGIEATLILPRALPPDLRRQLPNCLSAQILEANLSLWACEGHWEQSVAANVPAFEYHAF